MALKTYVDGLLMWEYKNTQQMRLFLEFELNMSRALVTVCMYSGRPPVTLQGFVQKIGKKHFSGEFPTLRAGAKVTSQPL